LNFRGLYKFPIIAVTLNSYNVEEKVKNVLAKVISEQLIQAYDS